jgi:hypothetical protein
MMPTLLQLVWQMSLRGGRWTPPSEAREPRVQTIDGMLFVGIRPATHRAA